MLLSNLLRHYFTSWDRVEIECDHCQHNTFFSCLKQINHIPEILNFEFYRAGVTGKNLTPIIFDMKQFLEYKIVV